MGEFPMLSGYVVQYELIAASVGPLLADLDVLLRPYHSIFQVQD